MEEKFNSIISPRRDYPFITISFGLGQDKYALMASEAALVVRRSEHGADGHKRPVLFPKLVFLFDQNLHGKGKELYPLFQKALNCSSKVMYLEYLRGVRIKSWTPERKEPVAMYIKEQEELALKEFEKTGSIRTVIRKLGYPSISTLYRWYEHKKADIENQYVNTEFVVALS